MNFMIVLGKTLFLIRINQLLHSNLQPYHLPHTTHKTQDQWRPLKNSISLLGGLQVNSLKTKNIENIEIYNNLNNFV